MNQILFVDGYNIIGAWDEAQRLQWPIDECRDRLANLLEEYAALHKTYAILVFDGYRSERIATSVEKRKHMQIIFTKKDETADSYIEKAVYQSPKYQQVTVATSDALQQYSILGDGATRMSARELLQGFQNMHVHKKHVQAEANTRNSLAERLPQDLYQKLNNYIKTQK